MKYLYAAVLDSVWHVTKFEIVNESEHIYFLANGSAVHKGVMHDFQDKAKMWYYTDEKEAERVLRIRECSFLLNKYESGCDCETRFDIMKLANVNEVAHMFIDMVCELCEHGAPSVEAIKKWLLSEPGENQEDYSNLDKGDTLYYVDFDGNKVHRGTVFGVRRNSSDGSIRSLALELVDDFMGVSSELLGKKFFLNEELARNSLKRGRNDE